jgi:predicted GNAT superfamily acetyltransferase
MKPWNLRILEDPAEMAAVEGLQRIVWPGSETDVIPAHLLRAITHNGGLLIGAFLKERLVGFVLGFPGLEFTPDGPRPKHASHELAVDPEFRNQGVGFALKRAQWQMVRHQGVDHITWTFDPLLSRNAYLNITRLGAVCSTYLREFYGEMRDGLNAGLPSDRLLMDWWINSTRVWRRLSKRARRPLDLANYLAAGANIANPARLAASGLPQPAEETAPAGAAVMLVEIPADFQALRTADPGLALAWRLHVRGLFESLFRDGYLATDFVHLRGAQPRSFYVFSQGEMTLDGLAAGET